MIKFNNLLTSLFVTVINQKINIFNQIKLFFHSIKSKINCITNGVCLNSIKNYEIPILYQKMLTLIKFNIYLNKFLLILQIYILCLFNQFSISFSLYF
jgi:hypothetical protein